MKKKTRKLKPVGGVPGPGPVSNIKPVRRTKGVGPEHGGPGFARSLPTHARVKSGSTGTFAV